MWGMDVVIELQEGSTFSLETLPDGGARIRVPKSAVERALLLSRTSYPGLVAGFRVQPGDAETIGQTMSDRAAVVRVSPPALELDREEFLLTCAACEPQRVTLQEDPEDLVQCPAENDGFQCCNVKGHDGEHQHRSERTGSMRVTSWPADVKVGGT